MIKEICKKTHKKKLAVFDIDGTIFRKNLAFELLNELSWMKIFPKIVRNELIGLYGHWLDNEGTYEAYRKKLVELYEKNIAGKSQEDIMKAAKIVAEFNIKRTYIFAKKLIEEMRSDHVMLVISGSPIEIVKEYAEIFGFDAYFGSVYEIDKNKIYTGRTIFEPTHDKGSVVKQFVAENDISLVDSFGMGDTQSDASFLELVDRPIAFNPDLNLRKIAEKNQWRIVVEKKDVIYEINNKN
ncbi:MAG: HAD-IB family phosphatase [Candidatus Moranbacteria bacterium]|nr:HAD-IB family phosphatase [Candidatus Moranbacteria bacterium]